MKKADYQTIVAYNLARHKAHPGDTLTLTVRNEESDEGIYAQAKRTEEMFLMCYSFFPQSIAMHPDHLALLKRQNKTLDITISDEAAKLIGDLVQLADLPRRIPLVADEALDLFTTVARFAFRRDEASEMLISALKFALDASQ